MNLHRSGPRRPSIGASRASARCRTARSGPASAGSAPRAGATEALCSPASARRCAWRSCSSDGERRHRSSRVAAGRVPQALAAPPRPTRTRAPRSSGAGGRRSPPGTCPAGPQRCSASLTKDPARLRMGGVRSAGKRQRLAPARPSATLPGTELGCRGVASLRLRRGEVREALEERAEAGDGRRRLPCRRMASAATRGTRAPSQPGNPGRLVEEGARPRVTRRPPCATWSLAIAL